ncbi:hypothetical protein FRB99_005298 [Tulasnella sp. 403]|nr:hypothetical protein FRB99_005298 [Tulasnella sp. 403]
MPASDAPPSKSQVALVVGFYMFAALVMVFVNKAVLNSSPNLPLLMLLIQFVIAIICLHVSALLTPKIEVPQRMLTADKFKQLLPILTTNVVGLTFNTLCLRDIARGLVLPFTIAVSAFDSKTAPRNTVLLSGAIVTFGFFFGITPSAVKPDEAAQKAAPFMSLVWGALSSLMTAVHAVLIKRSLPYVDNSTTQLAYWTNASAALILLPFVLFDGEVSSVWTSLVDGAVDAPGRVGASAPVWDWKTFVVGCLITGVVGFLLCVAGLLSIKVTSPVTHMFSSACRSVLQTLLGVWIFHDILNVNRVTSIFVILGGSMYYTWVKAKEADAKAAAHARRQQSPEDQAEEGLLLHPRNNEEDDDSVTVFEATDSDEELKGSDRKSRV